jgi:hypothetical protein
MLLDSVGISSSGRTVQLALSQRKEPQMLLLCSTQAQSSKLQAPSSPATSAATSTACRSTSSSPSPQQ